MSTARKTCDLERFSGGKGVDCEAQIGVARLVSPTPRQGGISSMHDQRTRTRTGLQRPARPGRPRGPTRRLTTLREGHRRETPGTQGQGYGSSTDTASQQHGVGGSEIQRDQMRRDSVNHSGSDIRELPSPPGSDLPPALGWMPREGRDMERRRGRSVSQQDQRRDTFESSTRRRANSRMTASHAARSPTSSPASIATYGLGGRDTPTSSATARARLAPASTGSPASGCSTTGVTSATTRAPCSPSTGSGSCIRS